MQSKVVPEFLSHPVLNEVNAFQTTATAVDLKTAFPLSEPQADSPRPAQILPRAQTA